MSTTPIQSEVSLLNGYAGVEGWYDEVYSTEGKLRPHWQRFVDAAQHLSRRDFEQRWLQAQRLLKQNSLAYPDHAEPKAIAHPWKLDAFPLVIPAEQWKTVAEALAQRAQLLDLVLRDLYGPQTLLREKVLPVEVLYRHPGFLLRYCRREAHQQQRLHMYAADLARSPDGQWWVLGDRTEAPSGTGFALENRIALSRMLPEVIHRCEVERLASYFVALKRRLATLSPRREEEPRVVILSRTGVSVNYFEDAFLARYLGYTLAEAGDLAVRENRVFLKTLGGLSPVDVLWRRPNSEHCDPLELSGASSIGVAGLMQAARSGNVAVVNSLGSGLIESPVLMAFLPQICMQLLGEPLKMPGVATWWCGEEKSRRYVIDRLDQLEIKPAYRRRGSGHGEALDLSKLSRDQLLARIEANPANYVGCEKVARSSAPVWENGSVGRSFIALRAFAVADGENYSVMPGGLTRISTSLAPLEMTLLSGEGSKDTWVYSEGPVEPVTLLKTKDEALQIRRGGVDLPSRAAENFFWLGRNTVRAEMLGRVIRIVVLRMTSEEESQDLSELAGLLRVLAYLGQLEPGFVVDEIKTQLRQIDHQIPRIVFDNQQTDSLRGIVTSVANQASAVRDLMSIDSWRILRQMDLDFWQSPHSDSLLDVLEKIDQLLVQLAAYAGYVSESMTRTYAWRFLDLGRRLERSLQLVSLIRITLEENHSPDPATLESLLEICDGLMTYRSRYFSRMQLAPVFDLLVTDETNPRSVLYQLLECAYHVEQLPPVPDGRIEQGLVASMITLLKNTNSEKVAGAFTAGNRRQISWLLQTIESTLPKLSDAVTHKYFFHSGPARQMGRIKPLQQLGR